MTVGGAINILRLNRPVPPPDLYKKAILFVLDTPNRYREVIKRLAAHQLHGNLTPGRFSVGCSHCLRRLHAGKRYHARTVTKQEYRPIAGRGCAGSRPVLIAAGYRSMPDWIRLWAKIQSMWHPVVFPAYRRAAAKTAHNNGNVFDEWV